LEKGREVKKNVITIFHCHSFHVTWNGITMENISLDTTTNKLKICFFSSNIRIYIAHIHLSKF